MVVYAKSGDYILMNKRGRICKGVENLPTPQEGVGTSVHTPRLGFGPSPPTVLDGLWPGWCGPMQLGCEYLTQTADCPLGDQP